MEENSDEIKLESLECVMEGLNDTGSVYVQEGFMSDSSQQEEELFEQDSSSIPKIFEMEMKRMKRRLRDLESEVVSLRSELRLVKRKVRDIEPNPDKYRDVIEKIVTETLDSQCYWKTIRFDHRASGETAKRKRSSDSSQALKRKNYKKNSSDSEASVDYRRIDTDDDDEIPRNQHSNANGPARKDTQSYRILHGAQSTNKNTNGPQKFPANQLNVSRKFKATGSKPPLKNTEPKVVVMRKDFGNTGSSQGKDNVQGKASGTPHGSCESVQKNERDEYGTDEEDGTRVRGSESKGDWDRRKKLQLIRMVRERPMLWNPADESYSKKGLRDMEWDVIAQNLGGTNREDVRSRWRVIRICFGSEKRKTERPNSGRNGRPSKWLFYKELLFLDPVLTSGNALRQGTVELDTINQGTREFCSESQFDLRDPNASVRSWMNSLSQSSREEDAQEG